MFLYFDVRTYSLIIPNNQYRIITLYHVSDLNFFLNALIFNSVAMAEIKLMNEIFLLMTIPTILYHS